VCVTVTQGLYGWIPESFFVEGYEMSECVEVL